MDAEIFKTLFPLQYMSKFIEQSVRVDGRQFIQPRQIAIEFTDGIANYQYSDCFISAKYILKEIETKEIDLTQCIKLSIILDNQDDLSNQEKARIERFYVNHLMDIIVQILDVQLLRKENNKVAQIEFVIRVAGSDGSLLSHLINCVYFALSQIKNIETQTSIVNRDIKCQTFAVFKSQILVDPSLFEELNSSTITLISFLDDGQYQFKKTDGKPLNFIEIQQIISQF